MVDLNTLEVTCGNNITELWHPFCCLYGADKQFYPMLRGLFGGVGAMQWGGKNGECVQKASCLNVTGCVVLSHMMQNCGFQAVNMWRSGCDRKHHSSFVYMQLQISAACSQRPPPPPPRGGGRALAGVRSVFFFLLRLFFFSNFLF